MIEARFPCVGSTIAVLAGMALAASVTLVDVSHASDPPEYLPVYGGPSFSPETGGYRNGSFSFSSISRPDRIVNNAGTAVATFEKFDSSGNNLGTRAVRWDGSGNPATELASLSTTASGFSLSGATAINNAGTVVGYSTVYDHSGNRLGERVVRWDRAGTATELGGLGTDRTGGSAGNWATDINDRGTAVGIVAKFDSRDNPPGQRAVRWDASGTTATELGNLGTDSSGYTLNYATAINAAGTAIGSALKFDASGYGRGERAVRWDSASMIAAELGNLGTNSGHTRTEALAINASGAVVGNADKWESDGTWRFGIVPVRWNSSGTRAIELGTLGIAHEGNIYYGSAVDINDAGTAVGNVQRIIDGNSSGFRAVRWDASSTVAIELGNLGTDPNGLVETGVAAINNAGIAVGGASTYDVEGNHLGYRAVFWRTDGVAIDLNTLIDPASGWYLFSADAITDTGWIAGSGWFDPDGPGGQDSYSRPYLIHVPATAVPEPASIVLFALAALGLVLTFARRERRVPCAGQSLVGLSIVLFASAGSANAAMFNASSVAELIAAIDSANQNSEPDSITLAIGATFTLTNVNNTTRGPTGLPTIANSGELTILGNGGVIERSAATATPAFRLFDVAAGASLALQNLTLQGGITSGTSSDGGAIYNAGNLTLTGVTVQNNIARGRMGANCIRCDRNSRGGPGWPGSGGGIYSAGSLLLENSTLLNNQAQGGWGGSGPGGRGRGGNGTGGGLYAAAGTATLLGSFVMGNVALGGNGSPSGSGYGGGIYIASAQVDLDGFTLAHVAGNTASTNYPNIYGPFEVIADPPLPGDFNADGRVDAADYVVWRQGLGTTYAHSDYNVWRANFGGAAGSATVVNAQAAVPEPMTLNVVLIMSAIILPRARSRPTSCKRLS